MNFICTCEHASQRVPARYETLFFGEDDTPRREQVTQLLNSHRGWDPGAKQLAEFLAEGLSAPLLMTDFTRLLIEPNRSLGHRQLFSEFTKGLDKTTKQTLVDNFYQPYRGSVETTIREMIAAGKVVVHLSAHTFTPVLDGVVRDGDVGFLYDPRRPAELDFCKRWRASLQQARSDLKVRRNFPYLGTADGFTTYLRKRFPASQYLGIEIEVNQKHFLSSGAVGDNWTKLCDAVSEFARRHT